jgi:tetratricopeptide (TPR) repeat protein
MLALVRNSADGRVEVPPTIQALLAARLDQLDAAERAMLERGSVEGPVFHRGAVEALADGEPQAERLLALVRKQLVRPDRPQLPSEDAYRFRHLLIRDAAYDALPKSVRADLHRRFAAWLETHGADLVELDEILGYHLEQAARHLADLGQADPALAAEAAERLGAAGRRARFRGDRKAARSLLERAVSLSDRPDVHLVVDLSSSVDDPREGARLLDAAAERAQASGDEPGEALARAVAAEARVVASECPLDECEQLALAAVPLLEAARDYSGLTEVWAALAGVYDGLCSYDRIEHAAEQALRYAALAGQQRTSLFGLGLVLVFGPRPVGQALARVDVLVADYPHAWMDLTPATLLAMNDRIGEARTLALAGEEHYRELGRAAEAHFWVAELERMAGDGEAAAERLRLSCEALVERGLTAVLSTFAPAQGRALCDLGRFEEAERLADQGRELGHEDDPVTQSLWRQVAARVRAHRGDHAEAERLAREAVAFIQKTDSPGQQGDALYDLAGVLEAAGRRNEAEATFSEALACYQRKGIVPLARRTRDRLAALQPA